MKHCVDEIKELITLHAFSMLAEEEANQINQHLSICNECKKDFLELEILTGTLSYNTKPVLPATLVKEKILSTVEKTKRKNTNKNNEYFITIKANEGEWQEISTGVFSKTLFSNLRTGTITSVMKMLPGTKAELHYHTSIEECYVISGDFHVGDSQETEIALGPGDYHCAQAGSTHAIAYTNQGTELLVIMPLNCEIACEIPSK